MPTIERGDAVRILREVVVKRGGVRFTSPAGRIGQVTLVRPAGWYDVTFPVFTTSVSFLTGGQSRIITWKFPASDLELAWKQLVLPLES